MRVWLLLVLGAVIGASMTAFPVFLYGQAQGERLEQRRALERAVAANNERRVVDGEINASRAPDLCALIGMRGDDLTECLRRLGKADAKP